MAGLARPRLVHVAMIATCSVLHLVGEAIMPVPPSTDHELVFCRAVGGCTVSSLDVVFINIRALRRILSVVAYLARDVTCQLQQSSVSGVWWGKLVSVFPHHLLKQLGWLDKTFQQSFMECPGFSSSLCMWCQNHVGQLEVWVSPT